MTLLSSGVRNNLFTLASNMSMMETVGERIATGKRVNSASDDPYAYFTSKNLTTKATNIDFVTSQYDIGSSTIQNSINALDAMDGLFEQAEALAMAAADGSSTAAERAGYEASYIDILNQVEDFANSAGFQGTNLLAAGDLSVTTEAGTSVGSTSVDYTDVTNIEGGLTKTPDWSNADDGLGQGDATATLANIQAARTQVQAQQGIYANDQFIMETRKDFAESVQNLYLDEVSNLTDADPTEEAANLTALQTRAQLAQNTLALLMQQQQGVLSLF